MMFFTGYNSLCFCFGSERPKAYYGWKVQSKMVESICTKTITSVTHMNLKDLTPVMFAEWLKPCLHQLFREETLLLLKSDCLSCRKNEWKLDWSHLVRETNIGSWCLSPLDLQISEMKTSFIPVEKPTNKIQKYVMDFAYVCVMLCFVHILKS